MELYKKVNLIRQENVELYKKVFDKLVKTISQRMRPIVWLTAIYFYEQLYEKEATGEVNCDSTTPYNFAVVENDNTPIHLELNTPPQENNVEQPSPPKLG